MTATDYDTMLANAPEEAPLTCLDDSNHTYLIAKDITFTRVDLLRALRADDPFEMIERILLTSPDAVSINTIGCPKRGQALDGDDLFTDRTAKNNTTHCKLCGSPTGPLQPLDRSDWL